MNAKKQRSLADVPGWLTAIDQFIFETILQWQSRVQPPGDLVEVGVYQGKSAIHIGRFMQPGERFTVCDLFDDARSEGSIREDARRQYATLSQRQFEENYLDFHDELPVVIRGLSTEIREHVEPDTLRWMHIDASHMYEHVREDTESARSLLREGGVVAFDDYRTEHTVGTAAAVWEAIVSDDLNPICCSSMKLYATWGDPEPIQQELLERIAQRSDCRPDISVIQRGSKIIRVAPVKKAAAKKAAAPPPPAVSKADFDSLKQQLEQTTALASQANAQAEAAFARATTPWTMRRVVAGVRRRLPGRSRT